MINWYDALFLASANYAMQDLFNNMLQVKISLSILHGVYINLMDKVHDYMSALLFMFTICNYTIYRQFMTCNLLIFALTVIAKRFREYIVIF